VPSCISNRSLAVICGYKLDRAVCSQGVPKDEGQGGCSKHFHVLSIFVEGILTRDFRARFALEQVKGAYFVDIDQIAWPARVSCAKTSTMKNANRTLPRLDASLLSNLPPFSRLGEGQIRKILDFATPRRYDEGVSVFEEGQEAERFFILLDGYIRVVRITPGGDQVIALHIPAGQLFGMARALGRTTYPATAITAADCVALSWPMQLWDSFVTDYDGFATETYKTVGVRMGEMQSRLLEMATKAVEQRIACALLRLINQTGRKVANGIEIDFPITRQDLSEMTGSTLHTVSRTLSAWEKLGMIESTRKRIVVLAPHQLMVLSQAG
jgi:CRP-like cAMP-binding protein